MTTNVLVAGATGMLGHRIATHLLTQPEVSVRLLLRNPTPTDPAKAQMVADLKQNGATVVTGDVTDASTLEAATSGIDVVVSALQGEEKIIVDGQIALAEAAARNGVRRFLPSDFAIDLFHAPEGAPQFAARRAADTAIDAMGMQVVHVLTGGFMDGMLDPTRPGIIDLDKGTAMQWGTGDERFNLTTTEDTARFAARLATDPADVSGVRYLSGAETSFREIFDLTDAATGTRLTRNVLGSADDLSRMTADAKDPWSVVPQWYLLSMLTVDPFPGNDNDRYADLQPTGLQDYLTAAHTQRSADDHA